MANEYEHDRRTEIIYHLKRGPVIVSLAPTFAKHMPAILQAFDGVYLTTALDFNENKVRLEITADSLFSQFLPPLPVTY